MLRLTGPTLTLAALILEIERRPRLAADVLQIGDDAYVDLDEPGLYLNHSCDPNACVRGERDLVAIKAIEAGEEFTFDYSTTMWEDVDSIREVFGHECWRLDFCACGAERCRGRIGQFTELPRAEQEALVFAGRVPFFVSDKYMRVT